MSKYRIGRDALTKEQMDKLMRSFDKLSDKALIGLAIATGMRRNCNFNFYVLLIYSIFLCNYLKNSKNGSDNS